MRSYEAYSTCHVLQLAQLKKMEKMKKKFSSYFLEAYHTELELIYNITPEGENAAIIVIIIVKEV